MTEDQKQWMDTADYETLLQRNRFGSFGDTIFLDESGAYFMKSMAREKAKLSVEEQVATSKRIGWKQ